MMRFLISSRIIVPSRSSLAHTQGLPLAGATSKNGPLVSARDKCKRHVIRFNSVSTTTAFARAIRRRPRVRQVYVQLASVAL